MCIQDLYKSSYISTSSFTLNISSTILAFIVCQLPESSIVFSILPFSNSRLCTSNKISAPFNVLFNSFHYKMHNSSDAQLYHYDPSLTAAIIFIHLFTLTTVLHIYQATRTRTLFMIPLIIGGLCRSPSIFECPQPLSN